MLGGVTALSVCFGNTGSWKPLLQINVDLFYDDTNLGDINTNTELYNRCCLLALFNF